MSWKQLIVMDASTVVRLQNAFIDRFIEAGAPPDAVMCVNKEPVKDGYRLFFSPAAASLASTILAPYSSTNCVAPDPGDVIVIRRRWPGFGFHYRGPLGKPPSRPGRYLNGRVPTRYR
jgi:hypothetical protein